MAAAVAAVAAAVAAAAPASRLNLASASCASHRPASATPHRASAVTHLVRVWVRG